MSGACRSLIQCLMSCCKGDSLVSRRNGSWSGSGIGTSWSSSGAFCRRWRKEVEDVESEAPEVCAWYSASQCAIGTGKITCSGIHRIVQMISASFRYFYNFHQLHQIHQGPHLTSPSGVQSNPKPRTGFSSPPSSSSPIRHSTA
jgi:hypothetical protein